MNAPDTQRGPKPGSYPSTRLGFADVGYDEAMTRARALIPMLRAEAAAMEQATRLTPKVLDAFHASGLFRYNQPKCYGGMELDFVATFDVPELLAQGDASAAWTLVNLASHHRQLTQWPERAQEEVWGENPDALIASGIAYVQGKAQRVDGGLRLTGEWGFSSGVDVSQWNMLACIVRENEKPVDWCMCLVPAADHEIVDDWQTLGMRATGSRTVRCKDLFVPAHRVISMHVAKPGHEFPGLKGHPAPLFRVPTAALGAHSIAAVMIGNARAALEATIAAVKARSTSYTAAKMRDFQTVQWRVSMAAAKLDAVHTWLRNDCVEALELVQANGSVPKSTKLRYKRNCAAGTRIVLEAIDMLYEMAGANGIYDHYVIQRLFRDAHAAAGHFAFSVDAQLPPWGLDALGGEVHSPTL